MGLDAESDTRLEDIERRLDRLERLMFITFQDVRDVAAYAYKNARLELAAEEAKRMPGLNQLSDREALAVGLMMHELAGLKQANRVLRKQVRLDALGIVRDLIRRERAATPLEDVNHERKDGPAPSKAHKPAPQPVRVAADGS